MAASVSSTAVSMRWLPPNPQHINGLIHGYHVNLTATFNGSWVTAQRTFVSNLTNMLGVQTAVLSELFKYTEYGLTVTCFTAAGDGPPSPQIHIRTLEDGKMMLPPPSWKFVAVSCTCCPCYVVLVATCVLTLGRRLLYWSAVWIGRREGTAGAVGQEVLCCWWT